MSCGTLVTVYKVGLDVDIVYNVRKRAPSSFHSCCSHACLRVVSAVHASYTVFLFPSVSDIHIYCIFVRFESPQLYNHDNDNEHSAFNN